MKVYWKIYYDIFDLSENVWDFALNVDIQKLIN